MDEDRWDRIEKRLERMEAAIFAMARIEEKVSGYFSAADRMGRDIEKIKDKFDAESDQMRERIRKLEGEYRDQSARMSYWERIGWMIVAGVLAGIQFIPK